MPDDGAPAPEHLAAFVRSLEPVDSALDLGCGDGRLAAELPAGELTLADVSAVALGRAERRVPEATQVELDPGRAAAVRRLELRPRALRRDARARARRSAAPLRGASCAAPVGRAGCDHAGARTRARASRSPFGGFEGRFDPLSPHLRFLTRRSLRELLDGMGFEVALGPEPARHAAGARDPIETRHADRRDGGGGLHRLARVRAAAGRRALGAGPRRLHALLRARAEGGQPRRAAPCPRLRAGRAEPARHRGADRRVRRPRRGVPPGRAPGCAPRFPRDLRGGERAHHRSRCSPPPRRRACAACCSPPPRPSTGAWRAAWPSTRRSGRSPSTGCRSSGRRRWPAGWRATSGSSWWCFATSRCTGRGSGRTWPSPAS